MNKENNHITDQNITESQSRGAISTPAAAGRSGGAGPIIKDDEIDLIALVKTIWDGRKTIYYSVGVCVFVGLLIAFLSPVKYTSSAMLLPSVDKKGASLGSLGALAGMAGINLSSMMGQASGIPAEIYPQVVNSYPFLKEFIHERFHFEKYEEPISIYNYVYADTIPTIGSQIFKYTIGLPWTIKEAISAPSNSNQNIQNSLNVVVLSENEQRTLEKVNDIFNVNIDKKTGLVNIVVEADEAILAAQFVQKGIDLLQKFIIEYKTQQSREKLEFVQERYKERKQEYENIQLKLFKYRDSHRNIVTERVDSELQRLNDEYDIASAVFKSLSQQLEQAEIAVKEETPAFKVLQVAKVPIEKSSPKRKIIILFSIILGVLLGIAIIFINGFWKEFKLKW